MMSPDVIGFIIDELVTLNETSREELNSKLAPLYPREEESREAWVLRVIAEAPHILASFSDIDFLTVLKL